MKTLKANYQRNVDILVENIKRGMSLDQVEYMINSHESQFKQHNLYGQDEKNYIQELNRIKNNSFIKATDLAKKMGIEVVQN